MIETLPQSVLAGDPPFPCPVCDSPLAGPLLVREQSPRGEVGIRRCPGCGLYLTWPRLKEPQGEYMAGDLEKWQRKYGAIDRGERLHDRHRNYLEEVAVIQRYVPHGRVLDVGCNAGWLLGYLQQTGRYDLEGLEPGLLLAEIARRRLGVPVFCGYLEELVDRDGAFDALVATDVIEHILPEQLEGFLRAAYRLLAPGGHIFVKTPNAGFVALKSRLVRLLPTSARPSLILGRDVWDAKEHVIHWDAANLARAFTRYGFEPVLSYVPYPIQTAGSPRMATLLRSAIYFTAQLLGGARRVPFFAQDILLIARKPSNPPTG